MVFLEVIFWCLGLLLVYVYVGYPMLLAVLGRMIGRSTTVGAGRPPVTLIISAFNERDVIGVKLENSIALDYPGDCLEVIVVSDASDDGTDEIVGDVAGKGVRLLRMPQRGGKTVGLNAGVQAAAGDIIVFSDANAMYQRDAIQMLVRNFADPSVGGVVGESTYATAVNDAEKGESAYWRYETLIKRLESRVGSVVGGDGAIYAIRRECYEPMRPDALSDFVNPLQIVERGWRCVYEPAAVSVEPAAGSYESEFRRKVRIVNRAWRALMTMRRLLNPYRYGVFAFQLISHKLLRWLAAVILILLLTLNIGLVGRHLVYEVTLAIQLFVYGLAIAGASFSRRQDSMPKILFIPYYFVLVNFASLLGILEGLAGKTYTTWQPARPDGG